MNQSGTCSKKMGVPSLTTLSHIFCVLKWSGTNFRLSDSLRTAELHISCVLRQSGIYPNGFGWSSTDFVHIFCIFNSSGISAKEHGLTASSTPWTPEIYFRMFTMPAHVNSITPLPISSIKNLIKSVILFIPIGPGEGQILWTFQKSFFIQSSSDPCLFSQFSCLCFFHLLTYTNPNIFMDVKQ